MNIPLDRLYQYIESIAEEIRGDSVIIYHFYPHGSKKLENLTHLKVYPTLNTITQPEIYCNDQEPLNFEYYDQEHKSWNRTTPLAEIFQKHNIVITQNLRITQNIYDKAILLHSEQRSEEVEKYKNINMIPVYYWSHAVIASDWFRYAKHITQKKNIERRFLVYNRAWSGTREYRLGFADRLIMNGLVDHTLMRVSPIDSSLDKHYDLHQFKHPHWRPHNVIENYFPLCEAESHYSADFDIKDYENTDIEVVLETLFDDLRLHLTEKTLRPIAMGQPFILAGTYGSLKYLRNYGFKTFSDCWDESYDMMTDSIERMNKIIDIMSNIVSMPKDKRDEMLTKARTIAEYNKQYFFSDEFQNRIASELQSNLKPALDEIEQTNTSKIWLNIRKRLAKNPEVKPWIINKILSKNSLQLALSKARQYYLRSLSNE